VSEGSGDREKRLEMIGCQQVGRRNEVMKKVLVWLAVIGCAFSASANLLLNPGFENGSGNDATSWWRYQNAGRENWANRSGLYGMAWWSWSDWYGGFGQDVSVSLGVGQVVQFTIWGNAETGFVGKVGQEEAWVKLEFWNGGTMSYAITNSIYNQLVGNYNNWTLYSLTHTNTASGITMVKPIVGFGNVVGYNNGAVKWDDASLDVIPEPAAVGLVGVGVIMVASLRRRLRTQI
jgi:hypothetical protein